jgi:hypothetical protein
LVLKLKAVLFFEMSATADTTTQCQIPEDLNLQQCCCGKLGLALLQFVCRSFVSIPVNFFKIKSDSFADKTINLTSCQFNKSCFLF